MLESETIRRLQKQNLSLIKSIRDKETENFKVVKAHQKLMFRLYALSQNKDGGDDTDPEMNDSFVREATNTFFNDIGYPDIVSLMALIKTNY